MTSKWKLNKYLKMSPWEWISQQERLVWKILKHLTFNCAIVVITLVSVLEKYSVSGTFKHVGNSKRTFIELMTFSGNGEVCVVWCVFTRVSHEGRRSQRRTGRGRLWWQIIGDSGLGNGQRIIKHSQRTHNDGDFSINNRSRSVFD